MENRGIDFGFGFLSQAASFDVQFSLIEYDGSHSYFRAYLVGLLNTLLVSVIGIIFATILGVIIGVARLSPNYLINQFAAFYVEFFRNIPLLLQIFFWYFAALRALPLPQNAEPMFGNIYMTIKGLYVPTFIWKNFNIFFYSVVAAIISIIVIRIHAKKVQETQGKQIPVFIISIGLIIILPLLSF
jgi:general L-amino acid transport system permease protein